ncbi:DUF559 domain-containing protein [Gordonia humi]|uniref:Very-short-patch-repair endonuclease n=2 Tax=Gordonia humi TaxID=686429 RepID=A0A840F5G2_9ACTN|nr:very-short-patch-repair endonuclease [Gordonia humi]
MAVAEFLADRDGVISTNQARELGMSADEVYWKATSGLWSKEAKSVYLSAEHRLTDMARLRIASLARGGVVDRESAVWLHGLIDDLPSPVTVSVPRSAHGATCSVPVNVRRRTFATEDLAVVDGIETTALPLTILIGGGLLRDGIDMVDRALLHKRVTLAQLRAAADRNAGTNGMGKARVLLASAEDESESELERMFVRFLRRRKIGGWLQQQWIGGRRIDFVWPDENIAVQLHGWAFHHAHNQWERDQQTTNMLSGIGWLPLIFTWKRLKFTPDDVEAELAGAFEVRRAAA